MKLYTKNPFLLAALIAGTGLMPTGQISAQTFTILHEFTAFDRNAGTNSDGGNSRAGLILSGDTLYGTTEYGGNWGVGTVFAIKTDGSGFRNLNSSPNDFSQGYGPVARLALSGNTLYGTTPYGGAYPLDGGTVFKLNIEGTDYTDLYRFTDYNNPIYANADGGQPVADLILSGNTLYGTAKIGGIAGHGTVFAINTDGTGFTNLHQFTAYAAGYLTNSDGATPMAGLILSGNTLYGTTQRGGLKGYGTVFALNTDGTHFTTVHHFTNIPDGAGPTAGLVLSGETLYGTTAIGGLWGDGMVFAIRTNGTGFTNLHSFISTIDGANPASALFLSGNTLYGTAGVGISGSGTVFAVNTNSLGFTNLYSFSAVGYDASNTATNGDGTNPNGLVSAGGRLYGTTGSGGTSGNGTVFSLSLATISPPTLAISLLGTNLILTWPADAVGFTLHCATNPFPPALWTAIAMEPVVTNGQNEATIPISGTSQFYRLSR